MSTAGRVPNRVGQLLIGAGAIVGVLAFTVLDWFGSDVGVIRAGQSTAGDIGDLLDRLDDQRRALGGKSLIHFGLSDYYFTWLGWSLLAAALIVAFVATLPTEEGGRIRILGGLLAVVGVAATLWAIDVYRPSDDERLQRSTDAALRHHGPGVIHFLGHTSFGAWAALAAFVLIGAGAALGPRRAVTSGAAARVPDTAPTS